MINNNQQQIVDALEKKGHFILAADLREVLADKISRREAEIQAIKYAGDLRDKVEAYVTRTLEEKLGMATKDLADLLADDLDKLEEKFNKILSEHLEFASNNPEAPAKEAGEKGEEGAEPGLEPLEEDEEVEEEGEEAEEEGEEEEEGE